MMIVLAYLLCFYFSLPGLVNKAGYSLWEGLIPFYNIYLLLTLLEINPFILIILSLGLIFSPDRMLIATIILVFLPFIICDAYNKGKFISILTLVLPFLMYPFIAYSSGCYVYDVEES